MLRVKSCAHMIPCACTHLSSTLSRFDRLIGFTSAFFLIVHISNRHWEKPYVSSIGFVATKGRDHAVLTHAG